MKMRFLPDEPVLSVAQDTLGAGAYSSHIIKAIRNTQPPFTFAIFGDWGTGKTSLLRMIEESAKKPSVDNKNTRLVPVWFNAWQYENEQNIIYPLLFAIKKQYEKDFPASERTKHFKDVFVQVVATSTLALTDLAIRVATKKMVDESLGMEDIETYLENVKDKSSGIENILGGWANQVEKVNEYFSKLLDVYSLELATKFNLHQGNIRFLILIDDLDRCLPQTTINLLEGMKNFLFSPRCIYILGLNPKIVYQGVRIKYPGVQVDGREYLEKIVNFSFRLDDIPTTVDDFINGEFKKLLAEQQSFTEQDKKDLSDFGSTVKEANFQNPRKIKRILNRFLLYIDKYGDFLSNDISERRIHVVYASKFIIMAEYVPQIFQLYAHKADRVNTKIISILSGVEQVDTFRDEFGIDIHDVYGDIIKMKKLFENISTNGIEVIIQQVSDLYRLSNPI